MAAIIIFALFSITKQILSSGKTDSTVSFFDKLIDEIYNLKNNEEKQVLFSISSDYIVVGFNKDKDYIGGSGKVCSGGYVFSEQINKPYSCEKDAGCLCLCKSSSELSTEDCETENGGICYSFDYDIRDDKNSCGYFILAGKADKQLTIKKGADTIIINKE